MIRIQWIELKPEDGGILSREPSALEVPTGCTVPQALQLLGFTPETVHKLIESRAVAVFGLYSTEHTVLQEGDRLEILDELKFDPMASRRRRAQHKAVTQYQKDTAKHLRRSRKQANR